MQLSEGARSTEWVKRLLAVVAALNGEVTRLTGKKPSDAIKAKTLCRRTQKPPPPHSTVPGRSIGLEEQKLPSGVGVCFLYQQGGLKGGRRRATDPMWSLEVYRQGCSVTKKGKRKVQGVPQSQTAALPRPQEEEETDKSKQAQTEQTYEKH